LSNKVKWSRNPDLVLLSYRRVCWIIRRNNHIGEKFCNETCHLFHASVL